MDTDYKCSLNEASLQKAKKELNEDAKNRLGAVETLRTWIEQQKHISCPTDTLCLLRFLRTAKFSQLLARERLENYLKLRTDIPQWHMDLDPTSDDQLFPIKEGIIVLLPGVDKEGRKVIFLRQGAAKDETRKRCLKDSAYKDNIFKCIYMVILYMLMDENVHVNGFILVNDYTNYTSMQFFQFWTLNEMKDIIKWQKSQTGRFKGFYYYNNGSFLSTAIDMCRPFLTKKILDRVKFLGDNLENMYKIVPMEMLPEEYLPDEYTGPTAGTVQQIADKLVNEIRRPEVEAHIRHETSSKWKMDKSQKQDDVPTASFRKLNVD